VRPPGASSGRRPLDQRTKRALWIAAGVAVLAALVAHHNITEQEIIIFCVIVPSIILHEVTHGYVAKAFGDDTAARAGRLTLNPVVHVDPVGTLIVPALLSLSTVGVIGWAKPVPVNVGRLRSPRNQGVLVSLAGPATNAALAAGFGFVFVHVMRSGLPPVYNSVADWSTATQVVFYASLVNVGLCVFNLIPVPPLDGSVLFERLLPRSWWPTYLRYRQYTMPVLIGLVLLNFLLYPHGPLTWLYDHLYSWWAGVLGV
jgi:Zn-dependent protease